MKRDTIIIVVIVIVAVAVGVVVFLSGRADLSDTTTSVENKARENEANSATVVIPFTEITHGSKSTVTTRVNYILDSEDQLHELWKMVDATGAPPVIDFKTYSVIAVFAGEQTPSGSAIAVSKIEDSITRTVSVIIATPGENCAQKHSKTTNYEIIKVPITSLKLSHEYISTTTDCRNT